MNNKVYKIKIMMGFDNQIYYTLRAVFEIGRADLNYKSVFFQYLFYSMATNQLHFYLCKNIPNPKERLVLAKDENQTPFYCIKGEDLIRVFKSKGFANYLK